MPPDGRPAASVESYRDEMIKEMNDMLRIPAMGPENGGQGEFERARFIEELVRRVRLHRRRDLRRSGRAGQAQGPSQHHRQAKGQERADGLDRLAHGHRVPGGREGLDLPPVLSARSSTASSTAGARRTTGRRSSPPSSPPGRCSRPGLDPELSMGLAIVADEEAGSDYGIKFLIKEGLFGEDDIVLRPRLRRAGRLGDRGGGEVASSGSRSSVKGKQVHASTPEKGINALRVGSEMLLFLADQLPVSTPPRTRCSAPQLDLRADQAPGQRGERQHRPGGGLTFFDIRLLPQYDPRRCVKVANEVARCSRSAPGPRSTVEAVRIDPAGRPSAPTGAGARP